MSASSNKIAMPILAISAAFALLLWIWWSLDHSYPLWDAGSHFMDAVKYADLLKHPHLATGSWWHQFLTVNFNYPLTQHLIYGAAKVILGYGRLADTAVNVIYLVLLSISLARITKACGGNVAAQCFAVFAINVMPWVSLFSHTQMLDFGHIALCSAAYCLLLEWQQKSTWQRAIFMAAAVSLAATAKQASMVFVCVPCLILLTQSLIQKQWQRVLQMSATGIAAALSLLLWVIPNLKALKAWKDYYTPQAAENAGYLQVFAHHLWDYLKSLPTLMSPLFFVLWMISLWLFKPGLNTKPLTVVTAGCLSGIPLMCFLAMNNAEARYILPAVIPAAVGSALLLAQLWQAGQMKRIVCAALVAIGLMQFVVLNFSPYPLNAGDWLTTTVKNMTLTTGELAGPPMYPMPGDDPYGQRWIFDTIRASGTACGDGSIDARINLMPSSRELSVHTLTIAALTLNSKATLSTFRQYTLNGDSFNYTVPDLNYYNWYVFKTGYQGKHFLNLESSSSFDRLVQNILYDPKHWTQIGARKIQDGSTLFIYKRIAPL